jgi:hypothetical protein
VQAVPGQAAQPGDLHSGYEQRAEPGERRDQPFRRGAELRDRRRVLVGWR